MSYSCMNGRLRALPLELIEPKVEPSKLPLDDDNIDIEKEHTLEKDDTSEPCKSTSTCNSNPRYFSTIPITLPHGLVAIHPVPSPVSESTEGDESAPSGGDGDDDDSSNCSTLKVQKVGSNMAEMHRSMGNVVIDHCWALTKVENDILLFALLGKKRQGVVHIQEEKNTTTLHALTTLHLYWREHQKGIGGTDRDDDSIDESFPNECILSLPYTATNICMNDSLLLVGSSMGATAYKIHDLIECLVQSKKSVHNSRHDAIPNLKIMNTFVVHAMDISFNYFAASSGDKLAIWPVDKIVEAIDSGTAQAKPTAAWGTKLQGKSRITCIQLSKSASRSKDNIGMDGKYVALADWNGSGVVFKKDEDHQDHKCKWTSITNDVRGQGNNMHTGSDQLDTTTISACNDPPNADEIKAICSWEEAFKNDEDQSITSPTFISICDVPSKTDSSSRATPVMAMSCPGSPDVRLYNLEEPSISRRIQVGRSESGEVQGLTSFRKEHGQSSLLCIDESDCLFQIDWSKFLDQCMNSQIKTD